MTRVGWAMLVMIVVAVTAFSLTVRIGSGSNGGGVHGRQPASRLAATMPIPIEASASPGLLGVPVLGVARTAIADSWGDARGGGTRAHHGTDLIAPAGTPVIAAAPGTVEKLFQSRLGGITLYERSADRRWLYYYAHLSGYAAGLREGQVVQTGERLGFVGDTGDAGPGNYHLHFGLSRVAPDGHWWQGEDIDPFPLLAGKAARR